MDVSRAAASGVGIVGDRRAWPDAVKARIVLESFVPGTRVAELSARYGLTRWQIYDWRKRVRSGRLALPQSVAETPAFASVLLAPPQDVAAPQAPAPDKASGIEVVVGDVVIRARGASEAELVAAIRAARRASAP